MRFNLATILALALGTNAALNASEVVSNINEITQKSSDVNDAAKSITITNAPVKGPTVVSGFKDIIKLATQDISAMGIKRSVNTHVNRALQDDGATDGKGEGAEENALVSRKKRQAPGYPESDQSEICHVFRTFVEVHQVLLSTVIGKHGLLSQAQFTQPIAEVLRTLEGGVDKLAFGIIDLVPTCAEGATKDKMDLDATLQKAETTYEN